MGSEMHLAGFQFCVGGKGEGFRRVLCNGGSSRFRCGMRSRTWMVKGARRKFHSDPVDFGVVGLDENEFGVEEDLEEEDLEDVEVEEVMEYETVRVKDEGVLTMNVRGDISKQLLQQQQRLNMTAEDGLEYVDDFEGEGFDDDNDLIDLSDESEDEMIAIEDEEDVNLPESELASYISESAPFQSASLEKYIHESSRGYIAPISFGIVDDFKQVWAAAIHPESRFREARNQYSRVGVNIGYNFPDFVSNPDVDLSEARLEDESLFKAKAVYYATKMPSLSISTSWEVENPGGQGGTSHFKRTMVHMEVDAMVEKLRPRSDKNRKLIFRSIASFFDGETELMTEGICEVAMYFASSKYATVAAASALDSMFKDLWRKYNLQFVEQDDDMVINAKGEQVEKMSKRVGETLLKQRLLREGKVLKGGILKVSSFLNHMVDAELMDACGEDLAQRLQHTMPNKILTVEATGLIPALSVARRLSIPVVFARKSRPITISESYQTMYHSKTRGTISELIVSTEYLKDGDRVLLIDDFLAGGSTVEALFKLANMAHARVVGLGVLIEKTQDGGRAFLSGYDVPVESLSRVTILPDDTLSVEEDEDEEELV